MSAASLGRKLVATVKKLGGTITRQPGLHATNGKEILVDAPDGQHWCEGGCACLVGIQDFWTSTEENITDLLDRIAFGLEPCDDTCGHME